MKRVSELLHNLLFGKHRLYEKIVISLFFLFGFAHYYLNREGLSKITVAVLLLLYFVSFLRLIAKRDLKIDSCLIVSVFIVLLAVLSNTIAGKFSYDFIVYTGIFYCTYLFVILDKKQNIILVFLAICLGAALGCSLVFLHYVRVGFSHVMDDYFGNADGISDGAASLLILMTTCIWVLYSRFRKKKLLFLFASIIPLLLMVVIYKRVGPTVKIGLAMFLVVEYLLHKKNKYFPLVPAALLLVFLGVLLFVDFGNSVLGRLQSAFFQVRYLDLFIEGSTRERVLMIFRDVLACLRFPLLGNGMYVSLAYDLTPSHNLFGSIGENYGIPLMLLLSAMPVFIAFKLRKDKFLFPLALYFLYVFGLSVFYGTVFLSRTTYFVMGALFAVSSDGTGANLLTKYRRRFDWMYPHD